MATAELVTPGGGLGFGFNTNWPGLASPNTEAIMKDILGDGDGNQFAEAFSHAINSASLPTISIPAGDPALFSATSVTSGPFAFDSQAASMAALGMLNDKPQATASPRRLTLNPLEEEPIMSASAIASFTESPKVSTTTVSRGSKRQRTDSDDSKISKSRRNSDSSRSVSDDESDNKKRGKKSTRRAPSKSEKEFANLSPQEQAKQRRLERNRIAATKWRLKKKSHINHLERDYNRYKEEYGNMREFASGLRNQVVELKTQLLLWQNQVRSIANAAENAGIKIESPSFPLSDLSLKEQVNSQIPSLPAVYQDDDSGDHENDHDHDESSLDLEDY